MKLLKIVMVLVPLLISYSSYSRLSADSFAHYDAGVIAEILNLSADQVRKMEKASVFGLEDSQLEKDLNEHRRKVLEIAEDCEDRHLFPDECNKIYLENIKNNRAAQLAILKFLRLKNVISENEKFIPEKIVSILNKEIKDCIWYSKIEYFSLKPEKIIEASQSKDVCPKNAVTKCLGEEIKMCKGVIKCKGFTKEGLEDGNYSAYCTSIKSNYCEDAKACMFDNSWEEQEKTLDEQGMQYDKTKLDLQR